MEVAAERAQAARVLEANVSAVLSGVCPAEGGLVWLGAPLTFGSSRGAVHAELPLVAQLHSAVCAWQFAHHATDLVLTANIALGGGGGWTVVGSVLACTGGCIGSVLALEASWRV